MRRNSVFDDWRYPCHECPKKDCLVGCAAWKEWVYCKWNEVCLPFRKARDERNMRYGR